MSIDAIETQDTNRSPFGLIARGSIGGAVAGYAAKHMLPLSESEMDSEFKGAMAIIREQSNKAKASAIETIRNIKDKSLAQDTFIKMVDAQKAAGANANVNNMKTAFNMRKIIKDANLKQGDMIELKGIIASVNERAVDMFKRCAKGFKSAVKDKRVTPAYVAGGAVLGFFVGLGQSVFRASSRNA